MSADPDVRQPGCQHLTGAYLSDHSDLDLLWGDGNKPASTLPSDIARQAPMRLDQEIICAAGGEQWRELTNRRHGRTPGEARRRCPQHDASRRDHCPRPTRGYHLSATGRP
ncbi:phosphoribosyl-dephospho-CoA transferase MdcG domain-containing protein [Bradyrhizobium sp. LLZ17]|uniref:Phosphoribosyl-dephospho-CoA transferase MdcG domain-containing protein n=1 Tax=Bradyrhizobium sp. LLZ17 TaxID=3239388 RepID=A0AB39XUH9_9BRAD